MSQRHVAADEDDRVLDAARACVLAVGFRRTTVTDVARRAGVSRMTLYRRFPDLEGVLAALMTREFGRLIAEASELGGGGSGRARALAIVVHSARTLAGDPLFGRLLDVDPELLLPYVTQRLGGMQRMAVSGLAGVLAAGAEDGSVRADAGPAVLAAGVELMTRGFVLSARGEPTPGLDRWGELARAVDGYLRP